MKKEPLVIVTLFDKILCSDLHPDGPIPHATGRCDGRQEGCECGYYDLHRYLDYTLLHLLISFLLFLSLFCACLVSVSPPKLGGARGGLNHRISEAVQTTPNPS